MGRRKRSGDEWQEVPSDLDDMEGLDREASEITLPYELPSGHVVQCMTEEEVELCKQTAKPYREIGANIPDEAWLHVKGYLELILLRERTLAQTRSQRFQRMDTKSQKEVRASIVALNGEINEFARRLDPLKSARGDDGITPAEWRQDVAAQALKYAQEHVGEFTWMAMCPNVECRHNEEPFYMILETPHFAFDPAAGPGVIWNEECAELVHRHYCKKTDCAHVAHRKGYTGSLSVVDAAKILRISPIGFVMLAWEKNKWDLGFLEEIDPDRPDTMKKYVL